MDLPAAGQLALSLMQHHGLTDAGWTFRFNRRKRALGLCHFDAKRIELSAPFVVRNAEPEIRDVILHEIAHALTPPKGSGTSVPVRPPKDYRPHGPAWRAACLRIGANPDRLNRTAAAPPGKYQATCPTCRAVHHRHRRPVRGRAYCCKACGTKRGKLTFSMSR